MKTKKWADIKNTGMSPGRIAASDRRVKTERLCAKFIRDIREAILAELSK